jgi:hypothetical protein
LRSPSRISLSVISIQSGNDRRQQTARVKLAIKTRVDAAPVHCLDPPVMGIGLWGVSHLCETGSLKERNIPNDRSDWQSTRRKQLRQADLLGATEGGKEAGAKAARRTNRNVL